MLVFTDTVTVEMMLGLDINKKPIAIAECTLYGAGDDRGPLCHQYFAFNDPTELSSWDFSQAVADSWQGITVDSSKVGLLRLA